MCGTVAFLTCQTSVSVKPDVESALALEKYYQRTTEAAKSLRPDMPILHNNGHIPRGRYDIFPYLSHLELE
jgi:hypothetical protein